MDITEQLSEPVLWSEGMLLTPQHLQQNDIYWQHQLRHQMAQLQPYFWGIMQLYLDHRGLADGKVKIERLQAVMPDGLVVQYPAPGQSEELVFDASKETESSDWTDSPVKIHLAVPVREKGAASLTSLIQRFDAVKGDLATDENTGELAVEISRLRPRLELLPAAKVSAKYVSIPVIEVIRRANGQLEHTAYHPPLLRMGGAEFLQEHSLQKRLLDLAAAVRDKARALTGGGADGGGAASVALTAQQVTVVQNLVSALPPLEVLVGSRTAHPFELYVSLAHLIGEMSSIGEPPVPMMLPSYQHDDINGGFANAIEQLEQRLTQVHRLYDGIEFKRVGAGAFEHELGKTVSLDRLYVELKRNTGQDVGALHRWIGQARIGTHVFMPTLRERRLTGATVQPLEPIEITRLGFRDGSVMFRLENAKLDNEDVIQQYKILRIEGPSSGEEPDKIVLIQASEVEPELPTDGKRSS